MDSVRVDLEKFTIRNWRGRAGNREDKKRNMKKVKASIML